MAAWKFVAVFALILVLLDISSCEHNTAVCGGDIEVSNDTGSLQSPNYPHDYQPNKICFWRLFAPIGYQVVLRFQAFNLENIHNCSYDKVRVMDGDSLHSPLIGSFCGVSIPAPIRSTSNVLLVVFESDDTVQKTGFSATYTKEVSQCAQIEHGCSHSCINTHDGYKCTCQLGYKLHLDGKKCERICGGDIVIDKPGHNESPNYPDDYPRNKLCIWRLSAPLYYQIELNFQILEADSHCSNPYGTIKIRDGYSLDSPLIPMFTEDKIPSPIKSTSNKLLVIFEFNSTLQSTKILVTYAKRYDECALSNGCKHSCINNDEGYKCACNMGYELHSDGKQCEKMCGGDIVIDKPGLLQFSNYLSQYIPNKFCVWRLYAPTNQHVLLKIQSFQNSSTCSYDKLQVRDGDSFDSHLITYCLEHTSATIRSTSNAMLVAFQPYNTVGYENFAALYMNDDHDCIAKEYGCAHSCVKTFEGYKCTCDIGYKLQSDGKQCEIVCGGDIEVFSSGRLEPPMYREDYEPTFCVWRLSVPINYHIGLTLQSTEEGNHDRCDSRSFFNATEPACAYKVKVKDGTSLDSPLIATFCGGKRSKMPPIRSTTNKLLVIFESYSSGQQAGFKATYYKEFDECASVIHGCSQSCINTLSGHKCACELGYILQTDGKTCKKECGGHIDVKNTGYFESPNYPNTYGLNMLCVWRLSVPQGYGIALKFLSFITEANLDTVTITEDSKVLNKFSGSTIPPLVRSTSNSVIVKFKANHSVTYKGFAATFTRESLNDCMYMEHGCSHFCVNTLTGYECSCDIGYKLHPDGKKCDRVCGGDIEVNNTTRVLKTPNYPAEYGANSLCVWRLFAAQNYRIVLRFQTFKIKNHETCAKDKIKVIDGDSLDSPYISVLCGDMKPSPISSSSNKLLIIFESDNTNQATGFSADVIAEFDQCASINHGCSHFCINNHEGYKCACHIGYKLHSDGRRCELVCGGTININDIGYLKSPDYPSGYQLNKFCLWKLSVPQGNKIKLNFHSFNVGDHGNCFNDKVTIIDGDSLNDPVSAVYCGDKIPPAIRSVSNKLLVVLESNNTLQYAGFSANYTTEFDKCVTVDHGCHHLCLNTPKGHECACDYGYKLLSDGKTCEKLCGGYIELNDTGHLESMNYPQKYPLSIFCAWTLSVPQGYQILLKFQSFVLENASNCGYDKVLVRDGDTLDSALVGMYCGNRTIAPIKSTSNKLLVMFRSDASNAFSGFLATIMKAL